MRWSDADEPASPNHSLVPKQGCDIAETGQDGLGRFLLPANYNVRLDYQTFQQGTDKA